MTGKVFKEYSNNDEIFEGFLIKNTLGININKVGTDIGACWYIEKTDNYQNSYLP